MFKKLSAALVAAFFVLSATIAQAQTPNITGNEFQTQTAGKAVPGTVPMCFNAAGQAVPCGSSGSIPSTVAIQDGKALVPASLTATGTLLLVPDTTGYGSISVQVTSAGVGATITYQASEDGATWTTVIGYPPNASGATTSSSGTSSTVGLLWFPVTAKQFRVQITSYVSGTVTAQGTLRKDPLPRQSMQVGLIQGLNINQVGGFDKFVPITPTVQAAAYSAGAAVGGLQTVAYFRGNGGSGILNNVLVTSKSGLLQPITFYIFQSNPGATTCTDKTAFALGAADISKLVATGPFVITPAVAVGGTTSFGAQQLPVSVVNNESTTSLYVCPVVGGTGFTPGSTTEFVFSYAGTQD